MIDRQIPPRFKSVEDFDMLPVEQYTLDNGIGVHIIEAGSQDVIKIDVIFPAGAVQAGKPLLASVTNKALCEGTSAFTSAQLSEKIDYFGAYISQYAHYHHAEVSLITLTGFLSGTLPLLEDIIKNPIFPTKELETILSKRKQEFLIDGEKVKTIAARSLSRRLFGDHPYGNMLDMSHFDGISQGDVMAFHKRAYTPQGTHIIVSGQPGADFKNLLNRHLGGAWGQPIVSDEAALDFKPTLPQTIFIPKDNAVQSALRIGRPLFPKTHPDYHGIQVLNTVLGGYFGSRLMTNIREEKGLTYGISSFISAHQLAGTLVIATEVEAQNRELAVTEIFREMEKLRTELISEEELSLVKNYMLGDVIRNFDGPFATSDNYKELIDGMLDVSYFQQRFDTIKTISAADLLRLANAYLQPNDFLTIIVGK